jgi:hypothetical protein
VADLLGYGGEVLFRMHNNGVFEFGPLRYVQGNVSTMCGFVCDRHVFFLGLDDMFYALGEKNGMCSFVCLANHYKKV